eukprot:CAMPEP_0196652840 /NCGR_PEP_ID=MMETSP1086-20130531/2292_1 /TAXON_ID=77921 /ORGANISM="Cyanoptyche  gloeocystis , Strain SAG4.97" /LENGTH=52 /DNA_ID=CAMNT_0041983635 /DNA_START=153 /DNA_END=311 /DNA_ORIENTATION=-
MASQDSDAVYRVREPASAFQCAFVWVEEALQRGQSGRTGLWLPSSTQGRRGA